MDTLKTLFKQPYWVIALIIGAALAAAPCITIDKDYHLATHPPTTLRLFYVGVALLVLSVAAFVYTLVLQALSDKNSSSIFDPRRVKEGGNGELSTMVNGCEIRVVEGCIEENRQESGVVVALPCNEYFDDCCVSDTRSSLGAYASKVFEGRIPEFAELIKSECGKKLGSGVERQKTTEESARSFGVGKCVLLVKPLNTVTPIAIVSTTTQRSGEGLAARISYLFDGMQSLFKCLADARISEVIMPILGSGHGQIDPPLAFVGLLLAIAEAARYGQGGQRPRRVTIVVFRKGAEGPVVDRLMVHRALALIGSQE